MNYHYLVENMIAEICRDGNLPLGPAWMGQRVLPPSPRFEDSILVMNENFVSGTARFSLRKRVHKKYTTYIPT